MPNEYLEHLSGNLREHSILNLIESITSDCDSCLEDAESNLQNLAKDLEKLQGIFSEASNADPTQAATNLALLKTVATLRDETLKELAALSSNQRAAVFFRAGKLQQAGEFMKQIKTDFSLMLSQSDYTATQVLALLKASQDFNHRWQQIPWYFNEAVDQLSKLIPSFAKDTIADCVEISQNGLAEQLQDAKELAEFMEKFLLHLQSCCRTAIAFEIDFIGRSRGLVPTQKFSSSAELFAFYAQDAELVALLQQLNNTSMDCVATFNNLFAGFAETVNEAKEMDLLASGPAKRLRYFFQGFDKAMRFNTGFCVGGIRAWGAEPLKIEDGKKANITCYQDLHDFSITADGYDLQNDQGGFAAYNNNERQFVLHCETIEAEAKTEFAEMLGGMMVAIKKTSAPYLARNGRTPVIKVSLLGGDERAHTIGFQLLQTADGVSCWFRDLNYGEFLITDFNELLPWLTKFFAKTPYTKWYNSCAIFVLPPKPTQHSAFITSYFAAIKEANTAGNVGVAENTARAYVRRTPAIAAAYLQRQDDLSRIELARGIEAVEDADNIIELYLAQFAIYKKITGKTNADKIMAAKILFGLSADLKDTNQPDCINYCQQCLELLRSIDCSTTAGMIAYERENISKQKIVILSLSSLGKLLLFLTNYSAQAIEEKMARSIIEQALSETIELLRISDHLQHADLIVKVESFLGLVQRNETTMEEMYQAAQKFTDENPELVPIIRHNFQEFLDEYRKNLSSIGTSKIDEAATGAANTKPARRIPLL